MKSKLFFSLNSLQPQKKFAGGSITSVTTDEMPGLVNISFSSLRLKKGGFLEPIWHPNANKIGYCVSGNAYVSIRIPTSADNFTIKAGDVFFIPQGAAHEIINIGDNEVNIGFAYTNTKPETMCLTKAIYSLSDPVFQATFNHSPDFLEGLKRARKDDLIKVLSSTKDLQKQISSKSKFNIAASDKPIHTKGGYLQLATKGNLPVLQGLGILGFGLNPGGVVEPHWHTNAGELVYIIKGTTLITVLAPDGTVETLEVKGGEGAFAPASHFHNIENIGKDDVEVVAYFTSAEPDYIGIAEVLGAYSNEMLSTIFNVSPDYFDAFKKTEEPLVIVPL